jgi:hypothetical protein
MVQRRVLKNQRRVGEAAMIAGGIALSILGMQLGVQQVSFGGLCIIGLAIFSIFWR